MLVFAAAGFVYRRRAQIESPAKTTSVMADGSEVIEIAC